MPRKIPQTPEERRESHAAAQRRYAATPHGKQVSKRSRTNYEQTPGGRAARRRSAYKWNEKVRAAWIRCKALTDAAQNERNRIAENIARRNQAARDGETMYLHIDDENVRQLRPV